MDIPKNLLTKQQKRACVEHKNPTQYFSAPELLDIYKAAIPVGVSQDFEYIQTVYGCSTRKFNKEAVMLLHLYKDVITENLYILREVITLSGNHGTLLPFIVGIKYIYKLTQKTEDKVSLPILGTLMSEEELKEYCGLKAFRKVLGPELYFSLFPEYAKKNPNRSYVAEFGAKNE